MHVLAIFSTLPPFAEVAREYPPRNEEERAALAQKHAAKHVTIASWENEADVLREARDFAVNPIAVDVAGDAIR